MLVLEDFPLSVAHETCFFWKFGFELGYLMISMKIIEKLKQGNIFEKRCYLTEPITFIWFDLWKMWPVNKLTARYGKWRIDLCQTREKKGAELIEVCRLTESIWKPHKSKDLVFLHGSYVPTFFPEPKKTWFFSISKFYFENCQKICVFPVESLVNWNIPIT